MISHSVYSFRKGLIFVGLLASFCGVALFMLSLGVGGGLAKSPESGPAVPTGAHWYVAVSGLDIHDCLTPATACRTVSGA